MNKEIRNLVEGVELRLNNTTDANNRTIVGYGIVFNSPSELLEGRFREIIKPEAINGVIERSDILALLNHDIQRGVLARSTNGMGSMNLTIDNKGVRYSFEAPNFPLGDEVVEGIKRGDIRGSSFAFTIAQGGDRWERQTDGTYLRTITKFENLFDMSPCYREAYQDTTVAVRSLDEIEANDSQSRSGEEPGKAPECICEADKELRRRNNYIKYNIK